MRVSFPVIALLALVNTAAAQDIDFGDDASQWANDSQCDDMRFEGPGMTTTLLLERDIGHDASDCAAAFDNGSVTLKDNAVSLDTAQMSDTPAAPPDPEPVRLGGTKGGNERVRDGGGGAGTTMGAVIIDGINFGDDSGQWVNDGECDDRRFYGSGMSRSINWDSVGKDASDCSAAYQASSIRLWVMEDALAATQCSAVNFGDDSGDYPNDSECDDYRFEGRGVAARLNSDANGQDASDCQRLCEFGTLGLRDY